jgi:hypothetical protein
MAKWNCNNDDMPKYDYTGFTYEGFKGKPWDAEIGVRVVLRNNYHRVGWGWTIVGIESFSKKDFPEPILNLKHDDGTCSISSSYELVKEEVWLQYYGQSGLRQQDAWVKWRTVKEE